MGDYCVDVDLQPCRLTRSDLAELLQVIEHGFPGHAAPSDLDLHSYLPGVVAQGHSLDDYLATSGLPDVVTRLEIRRLHQDGALHVDRELQLTFLPVSGRLRIASSDGPWVAAMRDKLVAFLESRRPWYSPLAGRWGWLSLFAWVLAAGIMAAAGFSDVLLLAGVAIGLLGVEFALVLDSQDKLAPYTEIMIRSQGPGIEWRHVAATLTLASVLVLLTDLVVRLLA